MWPKSEIHELKQLAYGYTTESMIQRHLTALNVHLNNYEKMNSLHQKTGVWKEVEREADNIKELLEALHADL